MADKNEGPAITCIAAAALVPNRRVKITAAGTNTTPPTVNYAAAGDTALANMVIGTTTTPAAIGQPVTVELTHRAGTVIWTATGAIASGVLVGGAANGQVDSAGANKVGVSLGVAAAAGDYIECFPLQV